MEKKSQGFMATGKRYAIASQGPLSSAWGQEIFEKGGNIADVAVGLSLALAVERPQSTGLGGGGFLLFFQKEKNEVQAWDFRERAPKSSHQRMFLDAEGKVIPKKSSKGPHSVATPGLVQGLLAFHREHGKLPLKDIVAGPIRMAREGFDLYPELAQAQAQRPGVLSSVNGRVVQKNLAHTLGLIAQQGKLPQQIIEKILATTPGVLSKEDFDSYRPIKRTPVAADFRGYRLYSMPPPSSGGVHVIQILKAIQKENLRPLGPHHPRSVNTTALAMEMAFEDRAHHLGDPDFHPIPTQKLISESHVTQRMHKLRKEKNHTTHFSLADAQGNLIASTQTINGVFGSGLVAGDTGIILNNEMDDFSSAVGKLNLYGAVGGRYNLVAPFKTPLSSMAPTIVLGQDMALAIGSVNGPRIITCVALTLLNHLEYQLPLFESVAAVRYHHQWIPPYLRLEETPWRPRTHYEVKKKNWPCRVQVVAQKKGSLTAISDPRGEGRAYAR